MSSLAARSALSHLSPQGAAELRQPGLVLREERALRIAHLFAAEEARPFGVDAPQEPNRVATGRAACAWIAPGEWLVIGEDLPPGAALDASDGYAALSLSGPQARALLSKSVPIDLDPRAFGADACARTLMGAIPIFLMARGADGFLLLVERALAHAAWGWLTDGARALTP